MPRPFPSVSSRSHHGPAQLLQHRPGRPGPRSRRCSGSPISTHPLPTGCCMLVSKPDRQNRYYRTRVQSSDGRRLRDAVGLDTPTTLSGRSHRRSTHAPDSSRKPEVKGSRCREREGTRLLGQENGLLPPAGAWALRSSSKSDKSRALSSAGGGKPGLKQKALILGKAERVDMGNSG